MRDASAPPVRPTRPQLALFVLIVLAGATLRVWGVGTQILGDDEWHSLHTLTERTYLWIATHFGAVDHCIPLTLFEKQLAETVGISEFGARILPLAFGVLALVGLPWLAAERLGWRVALVFAALLALSPQLVYFARLGRPYSVSFTCSVAALFLFERWWRAGGRRTAALFVLAAALAAWFHLTTLCFVLPAFAWALFRRGASAHARPLRALAGLGAALGAALAVLLGPALVLDFASFAGRSLGQSSGFADPAQVLELWRGNASGPLAFVFGLGLLWGLIALWKSWRDLGGLFLAASAGALGTILIARPAVSSEALVVARYALPVLALVLLSASAGLLRLEELLRREFAWWPAGVAPALFVLLSGVCGPLPAIHGSGSDWMNHAAFQVGYGERSLHAYARSALGLRGSHPLYDRLASEAPAQATVVEAPWNYESHLNPYPIFQRIHGRRMRAGFVTPPGAPLPLGEVAQDDARFRLRSVVWVRDLAGLRARGATYVVFHRQRSYGLAPDDQLHPRLADVESAIELYRREVGAPWFEDAELCVFELGR